MLERHCNRKRILLPGSGVLTRQVPKRVSGWLSPAPGSWSTHSFLRAQLLQCMQPQHLEVSSLPTAVLAVSPMPSSYTAVDSSTQGPEILPLHAPTSSLGAFVAEWDIFLWTIFPSILKGRFLASFREQISSKFHWGSITETSLPSSEPRGHSLQQGQVSVTGMGRGREWKLLAWVLYLNPESSGCSLYVLFLCLVFFSLLTSQSLITSVP